MTQFIAVSPDSEVSPGQMKAFTVAGIQIAVARVGEVLYAFEDSCTHQRCPLSKGELEERVVICACHGAQFDVSTGAVLAGPAVDPVQTYSTRVEDGVIQVEV